MFLETRVYQGSSGKVYPLPFTDRIATQPRERQWQAVHIENEFLRVMVLPEIGGRIHAGLDKTNGYDFFYRQHVIKPALVGLAGPWISGGVEFNWPQHHRPATFLPVNYTIEEHADGSRTIWLSDHDPMNRLRGMHGVCLHPGRAYLEVKVRLYNRGPKIMMEQVRVGSGIQAAAGTLGALLSTNHVNVIVLAVRGSDGRMTFNPSADTRIAAGDFLIVLGDKASLNELERALTDD
jgi:hypothetical protein